MRFIVRFGGPWPVRKTDGAVCIFPKRGKEMRVCDWSPALFAVHASSHGALDE